MLGCLFRVLVVRYDNCASACSEFREAHGRRRVNYSNKCHYHSHVDSSVHPAHYSLPPMRFQWEWGVIAVTYTSFHLVVPFWSQPNASCISLEHQGCSLWWRSAELSTGKTMIWSGTHRLFSIMNMTPPNYSWTIYQDNITLWYSTRSGVVWDFDYGNIVIFSWSALSNIFFCLYWTVSA